MGWFFTYKMRGIVDDVKLKYKMQISAELKKHMIFCSHWIYLPNINEIIYDCDK